MPKIQELSANGKPRRPDTFQTVTDQVWERLQRIKKPRWRLAEPEPKILKIEHLIKPKKKKV
jgi:hypothetical protein